MKRRAFLKSSCSLALFAALPVAGCHAVHEQLVVPTLEPIDASRPHVRYRPIQGRGLGRDAVLAALLDVQRLSGVDGYVQVVVDQYGVGDDARAIVTAIPITYGPAPKAISLRVGPPVYAEPAGAVPPDDEVGTTTVDRFRHRRSRARPSVGAASAAAAP